MKLKKLNAGLGLLSILLILLHIGYSVYAYLALYYNPFLKLVFAVPFMVIACLHAVLGMMTVFMQADGIRMDLYPKQNRATILQRGSAALIFPLLIMHINTFSMMKAAAEKGQIPIILLLIAGVLLFYAVVITHVAVSLTKALITLGLLTSRKTQQMLDKIIYVLGAVIYVIAVYAVVKGQITMFLLG